MEQTPWGPTMVKRIASEVRRHRTAKGMSTQQLADACAVLGWPIKRTVLSNLESGYRETITVPELVILARALGVPPVLLVFPVGQTSSVEIAPDVHARAWEAAKWFAGEAPWPGLAERGSRADVWAEWQRAAAPLSLYRSHEQQQNQWARAKGDAYRLRREADASDSVEDRAALLAEAEEADRLAATLADALGHVRQRLREHELELPSLLDNLRYLDAEAGRA